MLKTHKPSPFMFIFLLLHVLPEATILGGREQREESREQSMVKRKIKTHKKGSRCSFGPPNL